MRFTRLRLNGFKSFVDPTDLVIAPGLTGVVGPNGCGKSNLLEALRWVMGETRPTAMRGEGMEDVIFAGAASRPARAFAEVVLTIDNAERLAPADFNDSDSLDITRRITRDAGSAYRANGREVRARDVQMLFADASTGSHSPALVRQGQIAELISAKPVNRRRILEEAAGISGLYQRRHEAELKLNATETNLSRVADVLDQLAQQLQVLARQSRQAARYREIGEALRLAEGMLLFGRWREAGLARDRAEDTRRRAKEAAAGCEAGAEEASAQRAGAEADLPPLREEAAIAAAIIERLSGARAQLVDEEARAEASIRALNDRIAQLVRDTEREAALNRDAGETIERLRWEDEQLARLHEGHDERLSEAMDAASEASALLQERESDQSRATEDMARLSASHQSATRRLGDAKATFQRAEQETLRAEELCERSTGERDRAVAEYDLAEEALAASREAAEAAEEALADAESRRAEAQSAEAEARAARSTAEGEANALAAEVGALARLVERDSGGAKGQILDHVSVTAGYEHALGAALGDDLRAPLANGGQSGWCDLPGYDETAPLPAGVEPLSPQVRAPAALARRLGQIGIVDAVQGAGLQAALRPGQCLVSREGDLWRWDGLAAAAADAPSAAAIRLQQINRLAVLRNDLDDARARAETAGELHAGASAALAAASRDDQSARDARRAADQRVAEASRTLSRAEADRSIAEGKLEAGRLALSRHSQDMRAAAALAEEAEAALAELPDLEEARMAAEEIRASVAIVRQTMIARRAAQDDIRREGEARTRRRQDIAKELATWAGRLTTAQTRAEELAARREETEAELHHARGVPAELAARHEDLNDRQAEGEARLTAAQTALTLGEQRLRAAQDSERDAERAASEAREARARAEALADSAHEMLVQAAERIREELEQEPSDLATALDGIDITDSAEAEQDIARLRRQREALGAVNLRAEEDAREVQAEHDALAQERDDLEEAIKKLRSGIAGLNREGRERLLTAFEQVNENFTGLFTHLFGGGEARLILVESDDPLEAGLEIMCQPPGKKLSTLSLLSGGEQTLTALALIFAVFLANPAPICVLDEVDAPLDDANVARFCDLLDEMTRRTGTRFLVITHHAVTMSRMHRLFGVTMQEQGVSQLVSVDLKRAEALVA